MAVLPRRHSQRATFAHFLRCSIFYLVLESHAYQEKADSAQLLQRSPGIVNGKYVEEVSPRAERSRETESAAKPGEVTAMGDGEPPLPKDNQVLRKGAAKYDNRDDAFTQYYNMAGGKPHDDFDLDRERIAKMLKDNQQQCLALQDVVEGRKEAEAALAANREAVSKGESEDSERARQLNEYSSFNFIGRGIESFTSARSSEAEKELSDRRTAVQKEETSKAARHPGYHAMEIVEKLHPCLEEVSNLGKELNSWIASSQKANDNLKLSFNRIFKTVHTLKESKLERMFRQQHERVWKTLINKALQIQTVLEALYNPMLPGKGFYLEDVPYHRVMTDPEMIEHKLAGMTENDLSTLQKLHKNWYNTNRSLSQKEDPEFAAH